MKKRILITPTYRLGKNWARHYEVNPNEVKFVTPNLGWEQSLRGIHGEEIWLIDAEYPNGFRTELAEIGKIRDLKFIHVDF